MMKALLILAHGSRQKESNDEVMKLAEDLDGRRDSGFSKVLCAFNQFSSPTAEEQIDALVNLGAESVTVLPYFIAAGSHVKTDIPDLVKTAESKHPGVVFILAPHFGAFKGVRDLIVTELSDG
jgi:sirohydrochlorin ferrochelatase